MSLPANFVPVSQSTDMLQDCPLEGRERMTAGTEANARESGVHSCSTEAHSDLPDSLSLAVLKVRYWMDWEGTTNTLSCINYLGLQDWQVNYLMHARKLHMLYDMDAHQEERLLRWIATHFFQRLTQHQQDVWFEYITCNADVARLMYTLPATRVKQDKTHQWEVNNHTQNDRPYTSDSIY